MSAEQWGSHLEHAEAGVPLGVNVNNLGFRPRPQTEWVFCSEKLCSTCWKALLQSCASVSDPALTTHPNPVQLSNCHVHYALTMNSYSISVVLHGQNSLHLKPFNLGPLDSSVGKSDCCQGPWPQFHSSMCAHSCTQSGKSSRRKKCASMLCMYQRPRFFPLLCDANAPPTWYDSHMGQPWQSSQLISWLGHEITVT